MTDWTSLGIGLGLALLGGALIALGSRRWSLCPLRECPALEAGQRVEFTVEGKQYATVLSGIDGDALRLAPPLERGLPVSFEAGTFAELRLTTPAGVYEATIQFVGRQTRPQPSLIARVASRWRHIQRRRHERFTLPDEVSVVLHVAGDYWIGWVRDASAGGLHIYAPTALAPNARLTLELPAALRGIAGNDTLHAARVVACERAPTRHGYTYQLRLAFLDASHA
jgi:c-di-GMP-binding flagellar brake protein YcgR